MFNTISWWFKFTVGWEPWIFFLRKTVLSEVFGIKIDNFVYIWMFQCFDNNLIGLLLLDSIFSRFLFEKLLLAAKTLYSTVLECNERKLNRQIHWRLITTSYRFIRSRLIRLIKFFFIFFAALVNSPIVVWRFTSLANKICLQTNSMQVLLASARDLRGKVFLQFELAPDSRQL